MAEKLSVEELKNWRKKKLAEFQKKNKDNKMNKLQEILETKPTILSEKKTADGDTMDVKVNWAQAGEKTKNGRIYGKDLLQREIDKLQKQVEKNSLLGTADHSLDGFSNIKNASHVITSMSMDEAGKCWADLRIIPTSMGKQIMTLIKNKVTIGVSQRGFGEVAKDGTVSDSFSLQGIDIVANPSFSGGVLNKDNILESMDFEEKKDPPSEELIQFVLDGVFGQRQEIGHRETYEEFLKEHGVAIKADILVEHGVYPNIETALISMNEEGVLRKMRSEEKTKVWTADEVYFEARTAGVDPKKFAEKLNEMEARKKVDRDSGLSGKAIGSLLDEATKAGVNVGNIEERKKIFEIAKTQATPGELTLHERAILVDKKMVSEGKESNIEFIEKVLRHKDKEAEIQEKRMAVKALVEGEILSAGAFVSREETHRHVNRELRKRGLKILDEDGQ